MNTKDDTQEMTEDGLELPQEELIVQIASAASSVDGVTGGAALYRMKNDTGKEWKHTKVYIPQGYKTDKAILQAMIQAIEAAVSKTPIELQGNLRFVCQTYTETIVKGFNKQRETWETGGFINRQGNKVKERVQWKKLFKLADTYNVIVKKPKGFSETLRAATNRARAVAQDGLEYTREAEIWEQVKASVEKDTI